jgi:hypothetical protein
MKNDARVFMYVMGFFDIESRDKLSSQALRVLSMALVVCLYSCS